MTLIVLPFFTQVIVFFLFEDAVGEAGGEEAIGLALPVGVGDADGEGAIISIALCEGEGVGNGALVAAAVGAANFRRSLS